MSKLDVPESWAIASLGSIARIGGGKRIPKGMNYSEKVTPHVYLRVADLKRLTVDESGLKYIDTRVHREIRNYTISADDIYISVAGSIGICGKVPQHLSGANLTENADKISSYQAAFDQDYLIRCIDSPRVQANIAEVTRGAAQPKLSIENIKKLVLPVPPLGEQKRIVTKIESTQEKIENIERSVTKAEELIGKYREALLQKAFRGELVRQDPNDESVSELLEHIRNNRSKQDGIKKKKGELRPIKPEEVPFEIPKSWDWARLGEISPKITDGVHQKPIYVKSGVPFISVKDITTGKLIFENCKFVSHSDHVKFTKSWRPERGDILYTKVGATYGRPCIIDTMTEFSLYVSVALIKVDSTIIESKYLSYFLKSFWGYQQAKRAISGVGVPDLHLVEIRNFLIPLPSLAEQIRIVRFIETAMLKFEPLTKVITEIEYQTNSLNSSIFNHAFSGKLVKQDLAEGTGHDLLEKIRPPVPTNPVANTSNLMGKNTGKKKTRTGK
jgi:type I restriction enzyme S subunit